jgi:Fe-S oxidoreductase
MLKSAGVNLLEVKRNRDISFCCGAGGGMLFSEETEGKRINHERIEELTASGANVIATSCPFCQIMLRDGLADKGLEKVEIRDIVQFI